MTDLEHGRRASAIVLLGLLIYLGGIVGLRWEPYTFLFRDGAFYAQTNRSIAEGFTLRQEAVQPSSWYDGSLPWYSTIDDAWSNLSIGAEGEWYPKHSFLMPVASTPLFLLLGPTGLLLFNVLAMALGLFAGYRIAARTVGVLPAAVSVLGIASCPLIPYLAYSYSHDVFYAALVASGAAALLAERHRTAGLLLGLSVFAKVTNVLAVVPLVLFLFRGDRKAFLRLALAMALPVAALGLSNWVMYGAPWTTSYNRILVVKDGVPEIVSYSKAFGTSLEDGLARYFSTSLEGELWQAASLPVIACLGLVPLAFRSWRLAAGILCTCVGFAVLFALYDFGGARFFMPVVMLSVAPGAALIAGLARALDAPVRAWRAFRDSHRTAAWVPAIAAVALAVLVGLPWALHQVRAYRSDSMAADVERLAVRADKIPCDYFNMARQKWECSGLDREEALFTGRAIDGQCAFAGRPMLRIPAAPGSRRRIVEWRPLKDGGTLDLAFGLDEGSKPVGPLTFTIRAGAMRPFRRTVTTAGILSLEALEGRFVAGEPVELEIDPGPRGSALCLDVRIR